MGTEKFAKEIEKDLKFHENPFTWETSLMQNICTLSSNIVVILWILSTSNIILISLLNN